MSEMSAQSSLSEHDYARLARCVELAEEALDAGGAPYGSLITDTDGMILFEDRNRTETGDMTLHPEFAIAKWAAEHLSPEQRATSVTYTSGEHCAMCSSAHAFVGLGRIVYASSSAQLRAWLAEWGVEGSPLAPLAINDVAPSLQVIGPVPEFAEQIRQLQSRFRTT